MSNITKTNLNHYKVFIEVYKQKNMSYAAKNLGLTQPTVSYSIRELESALGVELFIQRQRGVDPTGYADKLYPKISKNIEEITQAEKLLVVVPADVSDLR